MENHRVNVRRLATVRPQFALRNVRRQTEPGNSGRFKTTGGEGRQAGGYQHTRRVCRLRGVGKQRW